MLQELAAQTGASAWAIGSMLFFLAVWIGVAVRVFRARPEEHGRAGLASRSRATARPDGRHRTARPEA